MRIPKCACLFHEKVARDAPGGAALNLLQLTRRWITLPNRSRVYEPTEPYDLPRVVVDLDAFESPHVRVADDGEKPSRSSITPSTFRKITARYVEPAPARKETGFPRKFAVTPLLVLQYALLGEGLPTAKDSWYREFIRANTRMPNDMPEEKMKQLASKLFMDPVENLIYQGFTKKNEKRLALELDHCGNFTRLRNIATLISTTHEGCQFLLRNDSKLASGVKICLEHSTNTSAYAAQCTAALVFLNNLFKSIKSKDLAPGAVLSSLALRISAELCILPAVKNHLSNYKQSKDKLENPDFNLALKSLQKAYVYDTEMRIMPWKDNKWHRRELLKLITGWRLGDRREADTPRELSFALLSSPETSSYSRYIIGLGEMGLANAIWIEWQGLTKVGVPGQYSFNVQLFTIALLLAKSPEFALKVLGSVQQDARPAATDVSSHVRQLILEHYQFHDLSPSQTLQEKVASTCSRLESLTKTVKADALRSLENVLAIDIARKVRHRKLDLDWRDIGIGEEASFGLVAIHPLLGVHVYEKLEGTRIEAPRS
jgi:hypothetical protein